MKKNPKVFIDYSQTIDDVFIIQQIKVLILFDYMIADVKVH